MSLVCGSVERDEDLGAVLKLCVLMALLSKNPSSALCQALGAHPCDRPDLGIAPHPGKAWAQEAKLQEPTERWEVSTTTSCCSTAQREGAGSRHSSASALARWHLSADAGPEELDWCLALTTLSNSPGARGVQLQQ